MVVLIFHDCIFMNSLVSLRDLAVKLLLLCFSTTQLRLHLSRFHLSGIRLALLDGKRTTVPKPRKMLVMTGDLAALRG